MRGSNRYLGWATLRLWGAMALFLGAMVGLSLLLYDPSQENFSSGYIQGMVSAALPMCAFVMPMSMYTGYFALAMHMGATRRGVFGASQLGKLLCLGALPLTFWLLSLLGFSSVEGQLLNSMALGLALGCLGEFIGVLSIRMGGKGIVLFTASCALLGAVVGLSVAMSGFNMIVGVLEWVLAHGALIALAASALLTGGSWLLLRRLDV